MNLLLHLESILSDFDLCSTPKTSRFSKRSSMGLLPTQAKAP